VSRPWPPGAVTGIGSLPGTEMAEALRLVLGELPDLPYLPELPARGPGADMLGRTATLLVDLPVEIQPSGWRLTARPGRDARRAKDLMERDLDLLAELAAGYAGAFKIQLAGPWTLAAGVELPSGHAIVADAGAMRDLIASMVEGLRLHLAEIGRRIPSASLVVQLDEPSLPAVRAGQVPTPSGYGTVPAVEGTVVRQGLAEVLAVAPDGGRVVHCCGANPPAALIQAAGADALSFDPSLAGDLDALGSFVDGGGCLWLGVLPATDAEVTLDGARQSAQRLWRALGFPDDQRAEALVPTPVCGFAGASPEYVRRALAILRDVGRWLLEI
jgi:Cobalamin-independent synthase, Catalytic domain